MDSNFNLGAAGSVANVGLPTGPACGPQLSFSFQIMLSLLVIFVGFVVIYLIYKMNRQETVIKKLTHEVQKSVTSEGVMEMMDHYSNNPSYYLPIMKNMRHMVDVKLQDFNTYLKATMEDYKSASSSSSSSLLSSSALSSSSSSLPSTSASSLPSSSTSISTSFPVAIENPSTRHGPEHGSEQEPYQNQGQSQNQGQGQDQDQKHHVESVSQSGVNNTLSSPPSSSLRSSNTNHQAAMSFPPPLEDFNGHLIRPERKFSNWSMGAYQPEASDFRRSLSSTSHGSHDSSSPHNMNNSSSSILGSGSGSGAGSPLSLIFSLLPMLSSAMSGNSDGSGNGVTEIITNVLLSQSPSSAPSSSSNDTSSS